MSADEGPLREGERGRGREGGGGGKRMRERWKDGEMEIEQCMRV